MAAEDILLKIGAVDNASAVFTSVRDAVTSGLSAITGASHTTAAGMDGVAVSANTARLALIATGVGAAVAVVAGITSMVTKAQELGEQFYEMSQRTGASTESLSTLKFVAEQSGITLGDLETGMTRLARAAGAAIQDPLSQQARLFTALGVTLTDTAGKMRPTDELMKEMADKLVAIRSPGERAAVTLEVFGRSGTQLLPMLLEGSAGIQTMQDRARELGLQMSGASASAADQLGDKWDELTSMVGGLAVSIGNALIPGLVSGVSWLIKIGETAVDAGRILADVGAIAFEPLRLGWSIVSAGIKAGIVATMNWFGEKATEGVNVAIAAFNTLGSHIGVTIEEIDWTPLTDVPAADFAAEWEASKNRVNEHWESIKTHSTTMKHRLTTDTDAVGASTSNAADQVEQLDFKMADLEKTTKDKAIPTFDSFAARTVDMTEFNSGLTDSFASLASQIVDTTEFMDTYDWGGTSRSLATSFTTTFRNELQTDTSAATIGAGLGRGLSSGLTTIASGGSFAQAAGQLGTAIGTAIGGPIGGLIGSAIGGATKLIGNLFGGTSRSASRRNVIEEIQQSISQGNIGNFAAFTNLSRATADTGSAKLTLDAVMQTFDLSAEDATSLLRLLTNRATLGSAANASFVDRFNELLGANENTSLLAMAATLVPAASGFDGMVSRPTLFLAGEAGAEHVNVTPSGAGIGGNELSVSPTFNITANTAADGQAIVDAIRRDALPMLEREIDRMLRRGSRYGNLEIDDRTLRTTL